MDFETCEEYTSIPIKESGSQKRTFYATLQEHLFPFSHFADEDYKPER